jgi:hypothetical protein
MKIEIGCLYKNRTLKYLVPALNYYGETFKTKFNLVFKLAFGLHDSLLDGSYLEGQKNIFILLDRKSRPDLYENFMNWMKSQEYYVTDYSYDDIEKGRIQTLVIAFPNELSDAYDKFVKGKYSKMFTRTEVERMFKEDKVEARDIFYRRLPGRDNLIKVVREEFGTKLEYTDIKKGFEYDIPPRKEEEFFNHNKKEMAY